MHQSIILKIVFTAAFLIKIAIVFGQPQRFVVLFKDKVGTEHIIENPEPFLSERAISRRERQNIPLNDRDLPVSKLYLDSLISVGIKVRYTTKWLNGALVELDDAKDLEQLDNFSFIRENDFKLGTLNPSEINSGASLNTKYSINATTDEVAQYGYSFNQLDMLGVPAFHKAGLKGEGMYIAVFDGGFRNADNVTAFDSLRNADRLLTTFDFVENEENVFDDHDHGTQVLSVMASNTGGDLIGVAPNANYVLLRTEEVANESRLEEFYWLLAAEYADSLGVDIINSSLGYNIFDDVQDNYALEDLDGNTALITIAADLAASTGMLVVTSAGNEGFDANGSLTAPADADSVLTVGAVNSIKEYASFSSTGPTADGRIKPDVVAQGSSVRISRSTGSFTFSSGTSFSTPLISGLAAIIWQAMPELTNLQLIDTIKSISSQNTQTDFRLGHGIPDLRKLLSQITNLAPNVLTQEITIYPNPVNQSVNILFPASIEGESVNVRIYDTKGAQVQSLNGEISNNRFYVDKIEAKGLLLLQISVGDSIVTKRILSY